MKLDRIATTFHLDQSLGSTVFSAYDKRLNYFFYGIDVCFMSQFGLRLLGDACFTATFGLWSAGSDRVAEILIVNFEFKASATNGLLLTN